MKDEECSGVVHKQNTMAVVVVFFCFFVCWPRPTCQLVVADGDACAPVDALICQLHHPDMRVFFLICRCASQTMCGKPVTHLRLPSGQYGRGCPPHCSVQLMNISTIFLFSYPLKCKVRRHTLETTPECQQIRTHRADRDLSYSVLISNSVTPGSVRWLLCRILSSPPPNWPWPRVGATTPGMQSKAIKAIIQSTSRMHTGSNYTP